MTITPPNPVLRITGATELADQLVREGVDVIFGVPGDQLMTALQALAGSGIRYIVTRHEQATTYMADGYARATGRPGVAMVVPGVGVYNAASGLATAYACSSPVLMLAGQVPSSAIGLDLGMLHEVHDQLDIVRPITKSARRVTIADQVAATVHEAFVAMTTGRTRPAHVEIPPDTFAAAATTSSVTDRVPPAPTLPDPERIAAAADALGRAERPLVVTGGGTVLADASVELRSVVEHLQALVVDTREGKGGFDSRHPLHVGTAWVNKRLAPTIAAADVVLAVGTRFAAMGLAAGQTLVHIDADPDQIGRNHPADIAVAGDARLALAALHAALVDRCAARPSRADEGRAVKAAALAELHAIGPQFAMVDALRAGIPEDGLLVPDTTTMGYACHMAYPAYQPRSYFTNSYMGTLGAGYPTALGVKVGRPERPVVTVVGDGGFLFCATELATAVQHDIHTVTVVFDDGAYGNSNRDQRENYGGAEYGTVLRNPDWVALARAFGADGMLVDDIGNLPGAIAEACAHNGSVVIAVPMDRLPSPF